METRTIALIDMPAVRFREVLAQVRAAGGAGADERWMTVAARRVVTRGLIGDRLDLSDVRVTSIREERGRMVVEASVRML